MIPHDPDLFFSRTCLGCREVNPTVTLCTDRWVSCFHWNCSGVVNPTVKRRSRYAVDVECVLLCVFSKTVLGCGLLVPGGLVWSLPRHWSRVWVVHTGSVSEITWRVFSVTRMQRKMSLEPKPVQAEHVCGCCRALYPSLSVVRLWSMRLGDTKHFRLKLRLFFNTVEFMITESSRRVGAQVLQRLLQLARLDWNWMLHPLSHDLYLFLFLKCSVRQ